MIAPIYNENLVSYGYPETQSIHRKIETVNSVSIFVILVVVENRKVLGVGGREQLFVFFSTDLKCDTFLPFDIISVFVHSNELL